MYASEVEGFEDHLEADVEEFSSRRFRAFAATYGLTIQKLRVQAHCACFRHRGQDGHWGHYHLESSRHCNLGDFVIGSDYELQKSGAEWFAWHWHYWFSEGNLKVLANGGEAYTASDMTHGECPSILPLRFLC